jgi:hypothetical protein
VPSGRCFLGRRDDSKRLRAHGLVQRTWADFQLVQFPFDGIDLPARNAVGQHWRLAPSSDDNTYLDLGLAPGDLVSTWTDVTQDGHFGIPVDGIAQPVGVPSQLPVSIRPGAMATLHLTWSVESGHARGVVGTIYDVDSVEIHETMLGVHHTSQLPLGYTLHFVEPTCQTY